MLSPSSLQDRFRWLKLVDSFAPAFANQPSSRSRGTTACREAPAWQARSLTAYLGGWTIYPAAPQHAVFAAWAQRAYTGAMRTARKIRYRLEWLALKSATKFVPLLSRKACYRLALLLGSLGASLDRRGRRVALSNLRVAFGDEISSQRRAQIVRESYEHFARTMPDGKLEQYIVAAE